MSDSSDALVVGGGVVGLSLARALAKQGLAVRLLSAGALGREGASAVPMALLNPYRGRTARAQASDLQAMAVTWRWAEAMRSEGLDPGAQRSGVLRLADSAKQAAAWATLPGLLAFGPGEAPAPYRSPHGGVLVPEGGWLDPQRWTSALATSASEAGADLRAGERVTQAVKHAHGWRVGTEAGSSYGSRSVYFATGAHAWPAGLSAVAGPAPSFEAVAGEVWTSSLAAPQLPLAGSLYLAPVEVNGSLLAAIGGGHRVPGPPEPRAAARLRRGLAWTWPAMADLEDEAPLWWGVRARIPGSGPVAQQLAEDFWWVGGFAGRGFLAAAAMAERLAGAQAAGPATGTGDGPKS